MKIQKPQKMTPPKGGDVKKEKKPSLLELLEQKIQELATQKPQTQKEGTFYLGFHLPTKYQNIVTILRQKVLQSPLGKLVSLQKGNISKRDVVLLFILNSLVHEHEDLVKSILQEVYKISL